MLWAGLIAFVLALVSYMTLEPSLWTVLLNGTELLGVVALFCLVCFPNSLPEERVAPRCSSPSVFLLPRVEGGRGSYKNMVEVTEEGVFRSSLHSSSRSSEGNEVVGVIKG